MVTCSMSDEINSPLTTSMEKELASDEVFISLCDARIDILLETLEQTLECSADFN